MEPSQEQTRSHFLDDPAAADDLSVPLIREMFADEAGDDRASRRKKVAIVIGGPKVCVVGEVHREGDATGIEGLEDVAALVPEIDQFAEPCRSASRQPGDEHRVAMVGVVIDEVFDLDVADSRSEKHRHLLADSGAIPPEKHNGRPSQAGRCIGLRATAPYWTITVPIIPSGKWMRQ